jgi:hypothetical protein
VILRPIRSSTSILAGRAETQEVSEELRERLLTRIAEAGGGTPSIEPAQFLIHEQ